MNTGGPSLTHFHYLGSHNRSFCLMYVQVGILRISRGPPTVPLTQILCNAVSFNSKNPRKTGTLCNGWKKIMTENVALYL